MYLSPSEYILTITRMRPLVFVLYHSYMNFLIFKMVHSFILTQITQNLEFVIFKCVTNTQPIPLPLRTFYLVYEQIFVFAVKDVVL